MSIGRLIPKPDYNRPGFCELCHVQIAQFEGGSVKDWLPNSTYANFIVNDGSLMRINMCKGCKRKLTRKDLTKLMNSVYKSWMWEIHNILKWPSELVSNYQETYGRKFIIGREDSDPKWSRESIEEAVGLDNMKGPILIERHELSKELGVPWDESESWDVYLRRVKQEGVAA